MGLRAVAKLVVFSILTFIFGDREGFVQLSTVAGPARGLRFRLDLLNRGESSYFFGTYERPAIEQILRVCQLGWTVWDCGTYLGFYTNIFARAVGPQGHVVAIEPDPNNLRRTKEHVQMNKFSNVEFMEAAIGGSTGEVEFAFCNNTNSHLPGTYVGASNSAYVSELVGDSQRDAQIGKIHSTTMDDLYISGKVPVPSLIKLDIEGAELHALKVCHRLVADHKPIIVLELHNPECDAAAWQFACDVGYRLTRIPTMEPIENASDVYGTILCTPRHPRS